MRAMNDDGTITIPEGEPTPDEKMWILSTCLADDEETGRNPNDAPEVIMSMMEDVRDSAMLAAYAEFLAFVETVGIAPGMARGIAAKFSENIGQTVDDFLCNTYGDL